MKIPSSGWSASKFDPGDKGPHRPPVFREAEFEMLGVETIAKIRRANFAQRMAIKAIWRDLHWVAAEIRCGRRQLARSERQTSHLHALPEEPMEIDPKLECHRTPARRVQATDQGADRFAERGNRRYALLGIARFRPDHHAQVDGWRSLGEKPSDQIIDLAAWAAKFVTLETAKIISNTNCDNIYIFKSSCCNRKVIWWISRTGWTDWDILSSK
jgi:hypothetical protein